MSNLHRILWFDDQVRRGRYPNSSSLSGQFEISNRQALRDIEYMVNSMGAPLQYIPGQRGYEYSEKTFLLPYQIITEEEQKILAFLAYRYSQYSYENSSSVTRLAALFDRLHGKVVTIADNYPFFAINDTLVDMVHQINQAISQRNKLYIHYYHHQHQTYVSSLLEPITLLFQGNIDYLVAYHSETKSEVIIDIEEIQDISFSDQYNQEQRKKSSQSLTKTPFQAKVELFQPFSGDTWYGYQVKHLEGQIFSIEFYCMNSFLDHLLGSSATVKLLGPQWLKDKLVEKCHFILQG
ncbi:helix-turn-helix transcriptional regulator [Pseudoneobacillus sp. C159]